MTRQRSDDLLKHYHRTTCTICWAPCYEGCAYIRYPLALDNDFLHAYCERCIKLHDPVSLAIGYFRYTT